MDNHTYFDMWLDFDGNDDLAIGTILKRGFNCRLNIDIPLNLKIDYLEKKQIPFVEYRRSEKDTEIHLKSFDGIKDWARRIRGANIAKSALDNTKFLLDFRLNLRKNNQEKIRKRNLRYSLDIDCSKLDRSFAYGANDKTIKKLVVAILESYKRNGMIIDSTKDFKKFIEISKDQEYLSVKFMDEAQAAEFILFYGDTLK